jgi:hypothetical protein
VAEAIASKEHEITTLKDEVESLSGLVEVGYRQDQLGLTNIEHLLQLSPSSQLPGGLFGPCFARISMHDMFVCDMFL